MFNLREAVQAVDVTNCTIEECEAIYSLASRLAKHQMDNLVSLTSPEASKRYLRNAYMGYGHEVFGVILLDNQNRVLVRSELFRGTLDGASVYPRDVVALAFKYNAAACLMFHNHPSGLVEPSAADKHITLRLRDALALLDIRTLDHVIVGKEGTLSFAERGLI